MSPISKVQISSTLPKPSRALAPRQPVLSRRYARWERRQRAPRGGQALILAVFIMLFAALLSSTFLILVASNTQTIGRSIDKTGARRMADEGGQKARQLMALSPDADAWQPEAEPSLMGNRDAVLTADELPPAPGDATYDEYWTPLDKAMGWALTQNYTAASGDVAGRLRDLQTLKQSGGHVYIKMPDPRFSREATRFMLESRLLSQPVDEVTDGGDKKFMLRVSSLGFSDQNPEVWARQLLYKATNLNGSPFSYANFVSNYDFTKNSFASTTLTNDVFTGAVNLPLKNLSGFGVNSFAPGQSLMLSDGVGDPFTGIIAGVNRVGNSVALKTGLPRNFAAASTTVSVVATLMNGLDAINDTGARTVLDPAQATQSVMAPVHSEVDALTANTDTRGFGNGSFYNLGLKISERAEFKARPPFERTWGTARTYSGFNGLTVTGPLDRSAANLKFYNVMAPGAAIQTPPALSAAQNKFFKLSFSPQGVMQVDKYLPEVDPLVAPRPIQPARLDLGLYQTRCASGQGIFLDNSGDYEKIGTIELNNSQLQRLWQRKSFSVSSGGNIAYTGTSSAIAAGTTGMRLSFPRPGVDGYAYPMASGSLEQRAIRGWVSPWEFLPRGALVELKGTVISVTSDPLQDDGTIDTSAAKKLNGQSYTRDYPAPASGIVCASGNLRVRGTWTGAPLTIVSGHNLYIEGAISAAPGKVALLAKGNVTLNPTQFLQRPAGLVDRHLAATPADVASQNGAVVTLKPGFVGRFKVGDAVAATNSNGWVKVTAISGDVLTLSGSPGALSSAVKLRQMTDPALAIVDADGSKNYAYALGQNSDNLMRIALNDGGAVGLGLRQSDQRVEAVIKAISTKPKYELHIKNDHNGNGVVDPNSAAPAYDANDSSTWPEMWIWGRIDNKTDPAKGAFAYNLHDLGGGQVGDGGATLANLQSKLATVKVNGVPGWSLTLPTSGVSPNPYGEVPMRRLAFFDLSLQPAGTEFKVPLTTSFGLFWNNTTAAPTRTYGSFWGKVSVEADQNQPEAPTEVDANSFGHAPNWQNLMALPSGASQASFSLQRDVSGDPNGLLPQHYVAGWHLESSISGGVVTPVYAPKIGATIYAESGSWFVIPVPAQITDPTLTQGGRWRRSFYQISVEGNIAQGVTPTTVEDYDNEPDPDGQAVGATKRWLDALACPRNIASGSGAATNWQTISYQAAPLAPDSGLALPSTAEVLYTYVE